MANETWSSADKLDLKEFLNQNKIDLRSNLSEDSKELLAKTYSVSDLIKFSKEAKWKWMETIKRNILSILEKKDEIDRDASEQIKKENEALASFKSEKDALDAKKVEDIAALKKLLEYDDDDKLNKNNDNNEIMEVLLGAISMNENNNQTLKDIKILQERKQEARDNNKLEEVAKINEELEKKKWELKWLIWQKDYLYEKYLRQKQDSEKYNDNGWQWIQEFKRWWPLFCKKWDTLKWTGQEVVFGIANPFKDKRRARRRVNRVISRMNEIWKDSTAWMKMVMNRCYVNWLRPIRRWMKSVANTFRLTNPVKFSEQYDKQVKEFISNLTDEIKAWGKFGEDDKKTIALIEQRLKRYKQDYKQKFLAM